MVPDLNGTAHFPLAERHTNVTMIPLAERHTVVCDVTLVVDYVGGARFEEAISSCSFG